MQALKSAYPDAQVDELDGVTVDLGDWWCNVRPSNTLKEPGSSSRLTPLIWV